MLIKEMLDRVLVNLECLEVLPNLQVFNLPAVGSDHSPIDMNTNCTDKKASKRFKFEAIWLEMEECEQVIKEGWEKVYSGSKVNQVIRKLGFCRKLLIN